MEIRDGALSGSSADLSFGDWVKERRKFLGLSRRALAARIGCSAVTIVKIEGGERRPSDQVAALLAKGLELSPEEELDFVAFARRFLAPASAQTPERAIPSLPVAPTAPRNASNLPAPATSFIGREDDVREAQELLRGGSVRLLTFTGPPGIGKTRLSLRVAEDLQADFADGVFFVALAPVRDPDMIPLVIARTLGVRDSPGIPTVEGLKRYLKDKATLLLLDNFEQVMPAAPLLGDLLQHARGLKVAVSSREILHVYGEHDFPVESLSLPDKDPEMSDPSEWLRYEAIRLFVERSRAVQRSFRLTESNVRTVSEICRRLDCLPLAIELAAARIRSMPPEQLQSQIDKKLALLADGPRDLPLRQQTLRHAIDWSFDLLNETEQAIFRRVAVFRGGCTEQAALALSRDTLDIGDCRDTLQSLVDKSLLRREDGGVAGNRYWMLETIREYALEKLAESDEADRVHARHAEYYLELALEAKSKLKGPEQLVWLDRLGEEHQNLLAALEWSSSSATGAQPGLRLAVAMWRFWEIRGYLAEGRKWLHTLLAKPPVAALTVERSSALRAAGRLALLQGDYASARALYEEGLDISQRLGDKPGISSALFNLGFVAFDQGDYGMARARYEAALPLLREMGDSYFTAGALYSLGNLAVQEEDYELAASRYDESLQMYREMGDLHGMGNALLGLGELARSTGDYEAAHTLNSRSLQIWEELRHRLNTALTLHNLGYVERWHGDLGKAHDLFARALKIYRDIEESSGLADCLIGLASIAAGESDPERAVRLISVANLLMENSGYSLGAAERKEYEQTLSASRAALNSSLFDKALDWGQNIPLEQAIAYATSNLGQNSGMGLLQKSEQEEDSGPQYGGSLNDA